MGRAWFWVHDHARLAVLSSVAALVMAVVIGGLLSAAVSGGTPGEDSRYIASVRQSARGDDKGETDAYLVALGRSACTSLRSGRTTLDRLTDELTAEGDPQALANAVVVAAAHDYCPNWGGK